MQNKIMNEWKILRGGRTGDFAIIICLTLLFVVMIGMNVNLIFQMTSNQTETIGRMQLENIKEDLQGTLSDAEAATIRMAFEVEQLLREGVPMNELTEFIVQRKKDQKAISNGVCFNAYAAAREWTIIPDFNMPADYHAPERLWYRGALEHPGEVYITEPYIDAASGVMCFTMSKLLPDGETVVGLDFNFADVQKSIRKMTTEADREALIVAKNGMIVGYTDMSLVGEKISKKLPNYETILERVVKMSEHESFIADLDDTEHTIFSSVTNNGWYMILRVDNWALYKESYVRMTVTSLVSFFMLVAIILFYLNGLKNRLKAEDALSVREKFLSNMSSRLREPLNRILKLSHIDAGDPMAIDPMENAARAREAALQLSEAVDNLLSEKRIDLKDQQAESEEKYKQNEELSRTSNFTRAGIISVLIVAMTLSMGLCIKKTLDWGNEKMQREVEIYDHQLSNWIARHQSILSMFTNMIAERPYIMDDYESAVKLLDDIAKNYPEISVCYMANPYKEHQVIMNNGWEGAPGWHVETRPWYIETERSEGGFSVSAPYFDDQTGVYCVTLSQVVYSENDEFLGIFAIDFYIDRLINVLGESYARDSYAFLVDRNGVIINHPNPLYQMSLNRMTDINGTEYQKVYSSDEVVTVDDYNDMRVACFAKKNSDSDFTVVVANRWWNIYGSIITLSSLFVLFLLCCIIAVRVLINMLLSLQADANQKLKEAADNAEAAGRAKTQFFTQMSHEIRTPLNAVLGMNEMILRESNDRDIRDYSLNIQSAGRTLLALINSILDFSKIEDGKMRIVPVRYDLINVIDDLVNMISERARKKNLTFRTKLDPTLPKTLYGDDVRIKQIITNLLTNAVKYTNRGSIMLAIRAESIDDENVRVRVEVKDTGIGIRADDMDRLFQSFQRLEEEKNRNIEGTGLGITIVQKLLQMMRSELEVSSVYGEGSTFAFTLEQKIVNRNPIGAYEPHHFERMLPTVEREHIKAPNANVMVVDDNNMNLKVMRGLLKANEIVPDLADGGEKCLELVKTKKYDIIFLDHMMPDPDGLETLRRLREEKLITSETKVVALTANAIGDAREIYLSASFDDYLSKPIITEELEAMLEKYLASKTTGVEASDEIDDEDTFSTREKRLLSEICSWLDLESALTQCMDSKGFLLEMLRDFRSEDKSEALERFRAAGDWKNYRITVHALKSTALLIGAKELSEEAKTLELASKDGDVKTIEKNHAAMLKNYAAVRNDIEKFLTVEIENV